MVIVGHGVTLWFETVRFITLPSVGANATLAEFFSGIKMRSFPNEQEHLIVQLSVSIVLRRSIVSEPNEHAASQPSNLPLRR